MPAVEPSSGNQEQLAAMIIPIFIILGLAGLSYTIYTAVKWLPSLRHTKEGKFDTEPKKGVSYIESCEEDEMRVDGLITIVGPRVPERAVHGYR